MSHSSLYVQRMKMSYSTNDVSTTFWIIILFAFFKNNCAINIDCNKPPQLADPQTCCSDGGRDIVSETCAKKFGITGGSSQPPPSVDTATCLAECVLVESKYMVGQNVNITAIEMDLKNKFSQDPAYVEAMTRSYQKCIPIAQRKMEQLRRTPQGAAALQRKCSPFSGIVLGCTYTNYFQNCPTGHWNPNSQCEISKQFLQKCAIY